jgi:hypothetical protein
MRNITLIYTGMLVFFLFLLVACGSQVTPTPTKEAKRNKTNW